MTLVLKRTATAAWSGPLESGSGTLETESRALSGSYSFQSRFEDGDDTNPEELIGAAHAGCFSMALANELSEDGYKVENVETDATVELDPSGPQITSVHLSTRGTIDDIDESTFAKYADQAKQNCPVSKALGALEITLDTTLES